MMRVSGHGKTVVTGRLWRIAVLTAAGAIGAASQAEAALYYWSDSEPGFSRPAPAASQRRQKPRRNAAKKIEAPETSKPQGPLIIAISIDQQKLRVYDANGIYAETPISSGMRGHSTPMGVFSVIQKHKLHHSNIYSNAPMPFMQRITWSGVAMHAGVLPGYPASHGCIRMPMAFAAKMWNWTRMGARVVITPGEITAAPFSHPLLAEQKLVPQPVAADEPKDGLKDNLKDNPGADASGAPKADKATDAGVAARPAIPVASLELRLTLGHSDGARPAMGDPAAATPAREQTRTADASGALPATKALLTMSDASGAGSSSREGIAVEADSAPAVTADASNSEAKSEAAVAESSDTDATDKKKDEAQAKASGEAEETKTEDTKAEIAKAPAKADDSITATTDVRPAAPDQKTPEVKKDQARLPDVDKPAVAVAPKRTGQIAVFISRKDGKLYVRQNFAPLFDVPVTIAPSDRPLGTHVFTAQADKGNSNLLHWSVVSLPAPTKYAERRDEDERASRRQKMAGGVIEMKPVPNTPAEALDRLTIPADAMARITEALTTGGSIVVSDQGIGGGETGEGTDFIVSLR
jgi:lipoprotein-anchoring transpeptidase ErfK/SrfK